MGPDERVEEIERIDKRAFGMACRVSEDPAQRAVLAQEAQALKDRLLALAHELRDENPAVFRTVQRRVSEAQLDLGYVIRDSGFLSLRLGDLLR